MQIVRRAMSTRIAGSRVMPQKDKFQMNRLLQDLDLQGKTFNNTIESYILITIYIKGDKIRSRLAAR